MSCPNCGGEMCDLDMTGITYLWPDETPFDPQPVEWGCGDCDYTELRGLTPEQKARIQKITLLTAGVRGA